jgi:hypothetical protein
MALNLSTIVNSGIGNTSQAWSNQSSNRALSTTYTNSTSAPIMVSFWGTSASGSENIYVTVNGNTITAATAIYNVTSGNCSFIVPLGNTYSIAFASPSTWYWYELR